MYFENLTCSGTGDLERGFARFQLDDALILSDNVAFLD
jgi:hypothetical protein